MTMIDLHRRDAKLYFVKRSAAAYHLTQAEQRGNRQSIADALRTYLILDTQLAKSIYAILSVV